MGARDGLGEGKRHAQAPEAPCPRGQRPRTWHLRPTCDQTLVEASWSEAMDVGSPLHPTPANPDKPWAVRPPGKFSTGRVSSPHLHPDTGTHAVPSLSALQTRAHVTAGLELHRIDQEGPKCLHGAHSPTLRGITHGADLHTQAAPSQEDSLSFSFRRPPRTC